MFNWICPQCGREVPPSHTQCPNCAAQETQSGQLAAAAAPAPPEHAPASQLPPTEESRPASNPAPAALPPRRALPTWAMSVLFAFAFLGLGSGIYWLVGAARGAANKPSTTVESAAAKPGAKVNPLQKYIEISGVRFIENAKKQTEVRFVVTNHSPAEISGLAGNVTIWGRTRNSEEDAAGTFNFSTNLGPWESKELTAILTSKLKIYELPDWQNVSADVQITSPGA